MDFKISFSRVKTSCMAFTSWSMTTTAGGRVVCFLDVLLFEGLRCSPSVSMVCMELRTIYVMCCS